ncbi:MAG: signal peptidase I [Coriobacteriia bacterium]
MQDDAVAEDTVLTPEEPGGLSGEYEGAATSEAEVVVSTEATWGSFFRWLLETLLTIAAAVALALFLQAYVVKTYVVPTGSMIPTIQLEDRIISNRLAYRLGEPQPGDVVVFDNPTHEGPPLVKRVIAVGGQTIDIRNGIVYIDGEELDEPWVRPERRGRDSLEKPVEIPEGYVWVMGDNRVGSSDSRVFGPVPVESIHGKAVFTYWPLSRFGPLE